MKYIHCWVILSHLHGFICHHLPLCAILHTRTHVCACACESFPTAFLQPKSCSMSLSVHSCSSEPKGSSLSSETVTQLHQHPLHPPSAGLCNEMVLRQAVLQVAFGQRKHVNHLGVAIGYIHLLLWDVQAKFIIGQPLMQLQGQDQAGQ